MDETGRHVSEAVQAGVLYQTTWMTLGDGLTAEGPE
jgi:hypothetical protein